MKRLHDNSDYDLRADPYGIWTTFRKKLKTVEDDVKLLGNDAIKYNNLLEVQANKLNVFRNTQDQENIEVFILLKNVKEKLKQYKRKMELQQDMINMLWTASGADLPEGAKPKPLEFRAPSPTYINGTLTLSKIEPGYSKNWTCTLAARGNMDFHKTDYIYNHDELPSSETLDELDGIKDLFD